MVEIPESIKIGCRYFKILLVEELQDNLLGTCDWDKGVISVVTCKEDDLPRHKIIDSLFHEIIHAVDLIYTGDYVEEETISKITIGWLSILRTNTSLDFKNKDFLPPSKLFTIDTVCDVTYPFCSSDCGISYLSSTYGVMKILKHHDPYATKLDFVRMVTGEIMSKLEVEQDFDTNMLNSLSNGLIQIFEESDIVELIRE
jgi:hypothetical protein